MRTTYGATPLSESSRSCFMHSDLQRGDLTDGLIFNVVRIRASSVSSWP
jgi:hypothetical protein